MLHAQQNYSNYFEFDLNKSLIISLNVLQITWNFYIIIFVNIYNIYVHYTGWFNKYGNFKMSVAVVMVHNN